jgi:glycerol-3-phosphate cytidylyltransferase
MKKKIIFTSGAFDLLHDGHILLLKRAKALGDMLIVGVSTNALIKEYKGINPILNYKQRLRVIQELRCVDKVVKQSVLVDVEQFKALKGDIFVLGDDWKGKEHLVPGLQWLKNHNYLHYFPYTKGLSTTYIKEKIISNAVPILKAHRSK